MRNFFRRFRRRLPHARPARTWRPIFENLESRELLAFNIAISGSATSNVNITTTATTKTFTATANNANVNVSDISSAMNSTNHLSVVIDTGAGGSQSGDITQSTDFSILN